MISAVLIQERPHISRQIQRREKILVQSAAADCVNRPLSHASGPYRKQSKRVRVLQFLLFQKEALLARSREALECDFRIAKLCWPLGRGNDRSVSVHEFEKVELMTVGE